MRNTKRLLGLGLLLGLTLGACKRAEPGSDTPPVPQAQGGQVAHNPSLPCGSAAGATCCNGAMCGPNLTCTNNVCQSSAAAVPTVMPAPACGTVVGASCCAGGMCTVGLNCNTVNNTCQQTQPTPATTAQCGSAAGAACCPGNMCTSGLTCGSNGICAQTGSLPQPTAPTTPYNACTTPQGQPGVSIGGGPCLSLPPGFIPVPVTTDGGLGRLTNALTAAELANSDNPSELCGSLGHVQRASLNSMNPSKTRRCTVNGNEAHCTRGCEANEPACWAVAWNYTIPSDNACEGASNGNVYLLFQRGYFDRISSASSSQIPHMAEEVARSLGINCQAATNLVTAIHNRRDNFRTWSASQSQGIPLTV